MVNIEYLSLRFLSIMLFILLSVMIVAGLYPFNFLPPNRVQWVPNESGLYFDGAGIAYTDKANSISIGKAVSVELLLKERRGSKNWGPKEIFSFYDDTAVSPSLLVGQWAKRIFIYSRFERNRRHEWYRIFQSKHLFLNGTTHFVTIIFDENEKAIYIDGQLSNKKNVELNDGTQVEFSGIFLLGNSPLGKNGWWGEIKGLAVYGRILQPNEIAMHSREVFKKGVNVLAKTPGCLALYPFEEGEGNTTKSILNNPRLMSIPAGLNALSLNMQSLPFKDMRIYIFNKADFLKNIFFFIPFGILISAIILKKYKTGYFAIFLIVTLAGGLFSGIIECFQLFLFNRYPGLADIFGNILGSGFGVLVTSVMLKRNS